MFRDQRRYGRDPEVVVRAAASTFRSPLGWAEPKLVFTCSWSDWFHEDADEWRDEAWVIVRACPQHTFQILTKRPELALERLPADWGDGWPNVWLGVSIENARHTWRADVLREIPAALRFISAEPLLGSLFKSAAPDSYGVLEPVSSGEASGEGNEPGPGAAVRMPLDLTGIGWVIVGGESGSRADARAMHPRWAREVRDAVLAEGHEDDPVTGTPWTRPAFHFKQWGSWQPDAFGRDPNGLFVLPDGSAASAFDADRYGLELDGAVRMGYAGANPKSGGKLLDGVEWCEIPDHGPLQLALA